MSSTPSHNMTGNYPTTLPSSPMDLSHHNNHCITIIHNPTCCPTQPRLSSPLLSLQTNPPAWPLGLTSPTGLLSPPFREPPSETRWKARRRMCRVGATLVGPPFSFSPSFSFLSLPPFYPLDLALSFPFPTLTLSSSLPFSCIYLRSWFTVPVNSDRYRGTVSMPCNFLDTCVTFMPGTVPYTLTCILPFFLSVFLLISPTHTPSCIVVLSLNSRGLSVLYPGCSLKCTENYQYKCVCFMMMALYSALREAWSLISYCMSFSHFDRKSIRVAISLFHSSVNVVVVYWIPTTSTQLTFLFFLFTLLIQDDPLFLSCPVTAALTCEHQYGQRIAPLRVLWVFYVIRPQFRFEFHARPRRIFKNLLLCPFIFYTSSFNIYNGIEYGKNGVHCLIRYDHTI